MLKPLFGERVRNSTIRQQGTRRYAELDGQPKITDNAGVQATFLDLPEVGSVESSLIGEFLEAKSAGDAQVTDVLPEKLEIVRFGGR